MTPPKCGTTWTQEIVWLLRNDVDVEKATSLNQFYRAPYVDLQYIWRLRLKDGEKPPPYPESLERSNENLHSFIANSMEYSRTMERPRTVKTHNSMTMLPDELLDKCKVIFVARNIKDMAISYYYHFQTLFRMKDIDLELFLKLFR